MILLLLALAGFFISTYALVIEQKLKKNPLYKALCDLSDAMSCTKPILSAYGKIVGISNALLGIIFYAVLVVLIWFQLKWLVFLASVAACVGSLYFGWILYTKVKTFCVLCSSIYLINILLLIISFKNL